MKNIISDAIKIAIQAGMAILKIYNNDFIIEYKLDQSPLTAADKKSNQIILANLKYTGLPIITEEEKEIPYQERKQWNKFWLIDPLDGTKEFIKKNGEFTVNIALIEMGVPILGVIYAPVPDILYWGEVNTGAFKIENASKMNSAELSKGSLQDVSQKLPIKNVYKSLRIVASRSHLSPETEDYINQKKKKYGKVEIVSKGSSLKLCMVAEGGADIYPRFAPTMEWDIAAGHAIIAASGGRVHKAKDKSELVYNKKNLLNPWFIAYRKNL